MKRKTIILLAVLIAAIASLFISCSPEAAAPSENSQVGYVTFGKGTSRSLSTEYGIKSYDSLYWFYTAKKVDEFGTSGETEAELAVPPKSEGKGIGSGTVGPFSQGAWKFTLYAYEGTAEAPKTTLVYKGGTTVVLKGGETKAVPVSVSLQGEYGVVDLSKAYFQWKNASESSTGKIYVTIKLNGKTDSNADINATSLIGPLSKIDGKYKLTSPLSIKGQPAGKISAGYYTCTVNAYFEGDLDTESNEISATAASKATQVFGLRVYGNATTFIKDDLTESVFTDVEFTVPAQSMVAFNRNVATVDKNPAGAVDSISGLELSTTVDFGSNLDSSATHILAVEVTDIATSTSKYVVETGSENKTSVAGISFNLNSVKDDNGTTVQNEVTEFAADDPVLVTTYIAKGLSNVGIRYNGTETEDQTSPEYVSYDPDTGKLVFKVYHFSEYYAIADRFDALNETTNHAYDKLEEAFAEANEGDRIVLYRDVELDSTAAAGRGLTLDLSGYSVNAASTRALQFKEGNSVITGKGTISSSVANVGSSVIRVGDNAATADVSLTIEKDVIVSSDTAYGITVFGAQNETLDVYGKVVTTAPENPSYDGCAISTVGSDATKSIINIYDGAVLSAENSNGIYMPSGELTVSGGEITGLTGIYVKSAKVAISGGTITGNGLQKDYEYYGNGGISTGDALVVDSCGYPNGNPSVIVTGGKFISKNAKAVGSYKHGESSLITGFIKGGVFSSDPEYKAAGYRSVETNAMYAVLICSDHNNVNGYCEYCGKEMPFAGGTGTKDDPYLIAKADHLKNISEAFSGKHFKLTADITVGNNYYMDGFKCATKDLVDGTLDGDGHTITVKDNASLFHAVENSTIKNLNVVLSYSMVVYAQGSTVLFDNVDVSGKFTVTGNEGAYVVYGLIGKKLSFKNCTSSAEMTGNSYNAVFVGYVNWYKNKCNTLEFIDCENKGTLVCSYASMFIGNPNAYQINCVVTDCTNSGTIQATATNSVFNYYYATTSNCYTKFVINGVEYKDIADGHSSAPSCFEDTTVSNTGHVIQGPQNTGMAITQNADGTFKIKDAVIGGKTVDHYTVYVGVYAALKEGGSSRNYVTETISASSEIRDTALKNLKFVDTKWVEAHPDAVLGELAGYVIYTLEGESYYMLVTPETDTLNGNAKAPQMIYVVAYDQNNKPLASTKLLGSIE